MGCLVGHRHVPRIVVRSALCLIAAIVMSADASLAKPPEAAAERVRLFEWFSTLGFPDVKHARFVRYPESAFESEGEPVKVSLDMVSFSARAKTHGRC